jgi:hypothetical protein
MNLPLPGLSRHSRYGTLAVALAAASSLPILALTTGTAEANASTCGFGSSSGNVETCMTIRGTGLHIDLAIAGATVLNSGRRLDLKMTRPGKSTLYGGWYYVPANSTYPNPPQWSPNANEPAGEYCAITLRDNGDGTSTQIGKECVKLTS